MPRVVGSDPGTSSLDLVLLEDGAVADQVRFQPDALRAAPELLARQLTSWSPIDLVAAPSGYGLPLVAGTAVTEHELDLMALTRPDECGADLGVIGFRGWIRQMLSTGVPCVFLPGGIHLPTVPAHRKLNTIDLGTADKVAVAALALRRHSQDRGARPSDSTFAVVEIGSVFTAVMIVKHGKLVDACAGSRGPIGLRSAGAWDGEVAYWLSPLSKADLFRGGVADLGEHGVTAFCESLLRTVSGMRAVTAFEDVLLSGAGIANPVIHDCVEQTLSRLGTVRRLASLPNAWTKHAAQGAALIADGLAGGRNADLVDSLELRAASGTILDGIRIRPG